jgi:hypothetical protein
VGHTGKFAQEWIQLETRGNVVKYVRYDQIVKVEAIIP